MPFTLIQGTFQPDTGRPDGDTVSFAPDDSALVFILNHSIALLNTYRLNAQKEY